MGLGGSTPSPPQQASKRSVQATDTAGSQFRLLARERPPVHINTPPPVQVTAPAPVQITASARAAVEDQQAKLARIVDGLPAYGQIVFRELRATLFDAVAPNHNVAHFESVLQQRLSSSIDGDIKLERISSGQWRCSCSGNECLMSVRTEVLGASLNESFEFLSELKQQARAVRTTLLSDSAAWMRSLSKGVSKGHFLDACRKTGTQSPIGGHGNTLGPRHHAQDYSDAMCVFCDKPIHSAHLGGKHRCRVTAAFRCPSCQGQWSSVQARFDPSEKRVLGQKCQHCQSFGNVLRWQFCDLPASNNEGVEHKPHRSDLCEACDSFGNCQGAFFEPFIISSAIELCTQKSEARWARSGDICVADAGGYAVAMLPHVFSGMTGRDSFQDGRGHGTHNAWSSQGGGKGKADSRHSGGGRGCFKCGELGHMAKDCVASGSGRKGARPGVVRQGRKGASRKGA